MDRQSTIVFDDAGTNEQAALIVAAAGSAVELTLSLERSGEASASLLVEVAVRLRDALDAALASLTTRGPA